MPPTGVEGRLASGAICSPFDAFLLATPGSVEFFLEGPEVELRFPLSAVPRFLGFSSSS
jgi:hypothetical protein